MSHNNRKIRHSETINVNELDEQIKRLVENKLSENIEDSWAF
jgi:hypothetical protein